MSLKQFKTPSWWYHQNLIAYLFLPLSWLYLITIFLRKKYYKKIHKLAKLPVPVIIVGNITVGGTGKTPLTIWLANFLTAQGLRPAIISRGYGGNKNAQPQTVTKFSHPQEVGDEAILLANHGNCPVVVGKKRILAIKYLLSKFNCNIIISDDGLQHYAIPHDLEIALIDAEAWFGNGFAFPSGPLREPISRLQQVNFIIFSGNKHKFREKEINRFRKKTYQMQLVPGQFINLKNPKMKKNFSDFGEKPIIAYAGIGNPNKFFSMLTSLGLKFIAQPLPDHYKFQAGDFKNNNEIILMTEKDAVKCGEFAKENFWYVPISATLEPTFVTALKKMLKIILGDYDGENKI